MTGIKTKTADGAVTYNWIGLFRLHSWWRSVDGREFVIIGLSHLDTGEIWSVELLEKDKEVPIKRPFTEIQELYKAGKFDPTSKMPV